MRPQGLLSICIRGGMCWHTALILAPPETRDLACELAALGASADHLPSRTGRARHCYDRGVGECVHLPVSGRADEAISAPDWHRLRKADRNDCRSTGTTAAQQEEESQAVQPGQMLKRHRSRRHGLAAYWSGGTGS